MSGIKHSPQHFLGRNEFAGLALWSAIIVNFAQAQTPAPQLIPSVGNKSLVIGLADRDGIPLDTWQEPFIDWFRELGYLEKSGSPAKAAADIKSHVAKRK